MVFQKSLQRKKFLEVERGESSPDAHWVGSEWVLHYAA